MKYLNPFRKRVETPAETISKAEHDRIVSEMDADLRFRRCVIPQLRGVLKGLRHQLQQERETVARLVKQVRELKQERNAARIQAEANAADALLWRTAREKRRRKPAQQDA